MDIGSLMSTGLQGMQVSQQRLNESARQVAEAGNRPAVEVEPGQDLAVPLVQMKIDQLVFDASAKVVSAAGEALGTLVDTSA